MQRYAVLLVLAAVLVAAIGWEIAERPRAGVAAGQLRAAAAREPIPLLHADHIRDWVAAVLARPLFSPDRRPAEQAGVDAAGVAGLPRLTGIMVGPFGRRAIFAVDGRKPIVVNEGGRIAAFTVKSIDIMQVEMLGPNGLQLVRPAFDGAAPPGTAPLGTAPPAAPGPTRRMGEAAARQ